MQPRTIIIVLTLCVSGSACAQGFAPMDSVSRKNEMSMDVTGFVRQFVPGSSDPLSLGYYPPTYLLAYKRSVGKGALRFGVGGLYTLDSDTGGYNSHTDFTSYDWRLHLRAGWERRWSLSRRWSCFAGFDGLIGTGQGVSNNFGTQAGRPRVHTTFKSFGAGPVAGMQFHLNRRIALYTESMLYWMYQESGRHYDFEDDSNDVRGLTTDGSISWSYPIAVWLAVSF